MPINICIIGVGNIGKRHLESILKIKKKLNIYLIEKDKKFLNYFRNLKNNHYFHNIYLFKNLSDFNEKNITLSILSTDSKSRYKLTKELIKLKNVKNIIFEKIVFNSITYYNYTKKLILKNKINSYVNYPRRYYKGYNSIKNKCLNTNLEVSGYNWRLASNCLHMIDLFLFLNNSKSIKLYKNNFEEIYKSKRDGYFDIYGSMIFYDENHNKLSLIDNINSFNINGHQIKIYNKKIIYIIYENKNMCLSIDNKNINKNYFNLDLQSNLSKKYLEDILTNNIKLSKYIDVIENEKIIISNLKKYFVSKKITFQVT